MKTQIHALTSTRAIAAFMVVLFHFGQGTLLYDDLNFILGRGNLGVGYFFVLSGFVLYISYADTQVAFLRFVTKRAIRIVPAYMLALALCTIEYFYLFHCSYNMHFVREFIYSSLMVQAFVPGYALSLNTAAWSVSVELFFYVVFPVLLFILRKRGQLFILFTVVMFLSSQLVFFHYFKNDYADIENFTTFLYNPLLHVTSFMTGMLAGWCFKLFPLRPVRYVPVPLLLLVLVIVILGADSLASVHFAAGMLAPVFALLILYIAIYNPVLLRLRPLVFLGEISYGVYILQFPVYKLLDGLNVRYAHLPPTLLFYISLVVLCSVAAASYYWFEMPARRKVNNWLARD